MWKGKEQHGKLAAFCDKCREVNSVWVGSRRKNKVDNNYSRLYSNTIIFNEIFRN